MTNKLVRERLSAFFADVGAIGGAAGTGKSKRRGDRSYYKALSAKAAKARKKK